jgi:hypothetical protein
MIGVLVVIDAAAGHVGVNIPAGSELELPAMDTVASVAGLELEHAVEPAVVVVAVAAAASIFGSAFDPAEYSSADEFVLTVGNSHSVGQEHVMNYTVDSSAHCIHNSVHFDTLVHWTGKVVGTVHFDDFVDSMQDLVEEKFAWVTWKWSVETAAGVVAAVAAAFVENASADVDSWPA